MTEAKIASNQNRIKDFFRDLTGNFQAVGKLLLTLFPRKAKLRITIDRTDRTTEAVEFRQMPGEYFDDTNWLWRPVTATLLGIARQ